MYRGKFASELSMQEVKEYYDELRQKCPRTDEQWADFNILQEKLIVFAYRILDGKTNGDVIKAIFDVTEVRQLDCCAFIDTSDDANLRVYKDWWNAPYKAESEEM